MSCTKVDPTREAGEGQATIDMAEICWGRTEKYEGDMENSQQKVKDH